VRIRHNYDARFFKYCRKIKSRKVKPLESGISFLQNVVFVADCYMENCGFWTHELTELSIIRILNKWGVNWRRQITFKNYKSAKISHFISPFGLDNNRCLVPQKLRKEPKW
jgi:hypothetical protein